MLSAHKVFKNPQQSFSNHHSTLKELNVESFLQTNIKDAQNSSKFRKSVQKQKGNDIKCQGFKNKVLRQFSNQNYSQSIDNLPLRILTKLKIKDFYSVQKPYNSRIFENYQLQSQTHNINEQAQSLILQDFRSQDNTQNQRYQQFDTIQRIQLKKQIKYIKSVHLLRKQKQSQRAIFIIKNHLQLIGSKVNQIQLQIKQNIFNFPQKKEEYLHLLEISPQSTMSNRLKKLNKLLRLLRIVQKFALQTQNSQQIHHNNQMSLFYSQSAKQKYSTNFNFTEQNQNTIQNQKSLLRQLLKSQQTKDSFKKQKNKVPSYFSSNKNQDLQLFNSKLKYNIQNFKQKKNNSFKIQSNVQDFSQMKSLRSFDSKEFLQDSVRKKLFQSGQIKIFQNQIAKSETLNKQNANQLAEDKLNQQISCKKSTQMAIKCLNLSVHVLNLFRHSFSQNFVVQKKSTNNKHELLSDRLKNPKQKEIKQLRQILVRLKNQTQKVYSKFKQSTQQNKKLNDTLVSNQKQKQTSIQSKVNQIYYQVKTVFRKLQQYCLTQNQQNPNNCL